MDEITKKFYEEYLEFENFLEFRCFDLSKKINGRNPMFSQYASNIEEVQKIIDDYGTDRYIVYVSCNTKPFQTRVDGGVKHRRTIFLDIELDGDKPPLTDEKYYQKLLDTGIYIWKKLIDMKIQPNMLMESGRGLHIGIKFIPLATETYEPRFRSWYKDLIKTLEKMGMGKNTQKSLKEVRDTGIGKLASGTKNAVKGAGAVVGAGAAMAVMPPATLAIIAAGIAKGASMRGDKKEADKHKKDVKDYAANSSDYKEKYKEHVVQQNVIEKDRVNKVSVAEQERDKKMESIKLNILNLNPSEIKNAEADVQKDLSGRVKQIQEEHVKALSDIGDEPVKPIDVSKGAHNRVKYEGSVTKGALAVGESKRAKSKKNKEAMDKFGGEDNVKDMLGLDGDVPEKPAPKPDDKPES